MKEYPIDFNTEMVKAILKGRKTQTRRPVKESKIDKNGTKGHIFCPYGKIGDNLWVREPKALCMGININLKITNIKVEQIQDITTTDAWNEGCPHSDVSAISMWFKPYWDSIYKEKGYGWDVNPLVWVIEFCPPNISNYEQQIK